MNADKENHEVIGVHRRSSAAQIVLLPVPQGAEKKSNSSHR
jgi:hypothetical protein